MVKIKFDHELDLTMFKDKLREEQLMWRVLSDHELEILDQELEKISQLFMQMFYAVDLKPKLIEILINRYFYDDFDEMNAILAYAAQMLLTDQFDDVAFLSDLRLTMKQYFSLESEQTFIHYDKQKHVFFEQAGWLLEEVTARAIDEKKQEERYQVFLQSLREYVKTRERGPLCFVKWTADEIQIFHENGHRYTLAELNDIIMETPIHIYQFAQNEQKISPFLALNPRQILIYSDDEADPIIMSLQNIFDERLVIIRNNIFPFENK
ncbi:sporulation protein YtxC [Amphibacillus indicireducens]|uniref:Sporulation protein YtxC n=1 Tax=Amphibacillus indicireducens TaxID=1076330 RepID=A0ABP7W2U9_9BACI